MKVVKAILRELFSLFVDDDSFALAIVCWLLVGWAAVAVIGSGAAWLGLVFFAGLAAILLESALRRAGK